MFFVYVAVVLDYLLYQGKAGQDQGQFGLGLMPD